MYLATYVIHYLSCLNFDLQQATILREGLQGFVFESNRGTRVNTTAENPLGSQFQFGWSGKKGKKTKTKVEQTTEKVSKLAQELQLKYFSVAQESTRKVAAEMRTILSSVESACVAHDRNIVSYVFLMCLLILSLSLSRSPCVYSCEFRVGV